ncbi:MAG: ATP-binding protein [Saprospiraceae bacterium]
MCANLYAQQYQFVYYTPRDGLVNSRVRSIMQDSKGQMYFITVGGLSIYDGVRFRNYRQQDGLAAELVNDIIEITPDSFLIAPNSSFLNTLVKGRIGSFKTADNFYPVINKFLKSKDGSLYAIADEGLFTLHENKFIHIPLKYANGTNIGNLNQITEWKQYLIMTPWNYPQKEKLIIYDKEKKVVAGSITDRFISSTAVGPNGELLISSASGLEVLDSLALRAGRIEFVPFISKNESAKWKNSIIYTDPNRQTWILQKNEFFNITDVRHPVPFSSEHGLKTGNFSDIFIDHEGSTWLASDGHGVVKLPGTNVHFLDDFIPGIKNNISVLIQQNDTTWMYNITDNSFYRLYKGQLNLFPLRGNTIYATQLFIIHRSLYFIADNHLYKIEDKDQVSSYTRPILISPDSVPVHIYASGISDPNGLRIQCASFRGDTYYLLIMDQKGVQMKMPLSFIGDQMTFDANQNLWVTTRDSRLIGYSLHPENPSQYLQAEFDYSAKITDTSPRSIAVDSIGNIWVGTRFQGIYLLEKQAGTHGLSFQITTKNGLIENFHYQLHCDPKNNIWAASQTGMDKISLKDGEYVIDNVTRSKNIFQGISTIINVNRDLIWARTTTGDILSVHDVPAQRPYPKPSFFITSLLVNDSAYDISNAIFNHHQNNLTISVAAPSFIDEKSIKYSYRLKGSRKNTWSEPSNTADFHFINLDFGQYVLEIKAEFKAGIYPDQEIRYAFTIRPPFGRTWWFVSILITFIFGMVVMMFRYYYAVKLEAQKRMLEKKRAIEQERTRIATDMHDDLGAGLSRIKFLSETIGIRKQQQLPVDEEITSIRLYAHEMIDKMGEIVWALNEKNDSLSDLLSYTRAYAMEYLAENGITCQIDKLPAMNPIMLNGEFRRNIYLSVKESLHNIVKHARANRVTVRFEVNDHLRIIICDDGIGFNPENINTFGNGINNIQKRMTDIGGHMEIRHNQGTCVILTAPLPS